MFITFITISVTIIIFFILFLYFNVMLLKCILYTFVYVMHH